MTTPDKDEAEDEGADEGAEHIRPMDFSIFVLSLNTSALVHLGEASESEGGGLNLPMARQTIDMLALLEEKTKGNLTGNEERLLHQVLFDLRMRYTKVADGP